MLLLIFLYLFSVLNVEYEPFSSGMAAITTILGFLTMEHKNTGSVLAGSHVYFETKDLLTKTWGGQIFWANEFDTDAMCSYIADKKTVGHLARYAFQCSVHTYA